MTKEATSHAYEKRKAVVQKHDSLSHKSSHAYDFWTGENILQEQTHVPLLPISVFASLIMSYPGVRGLGAVSSSFAHCMCFKSEKARCADSSGKCCGCFHTTHHLPPPVFECRILFVCRKETIFWNIFTLMLITLFTSAIFFCTLATI